MEQRLSQSFRIGLVMFVGILAMSSASIFIRMAQADRVPSIVIAAYRMTVATLILSPAAIRQQSWRTYAKLELRSVGLTVLSGVLLGLHFATWITSLEHTSVVSSVVLVTTTPLWIALASPLVLGERTPARAWLGIAVAVAGGIIIGLSGQANSTANSVWGNGLALTGAVMAAGYLLIGRDARDKLDLISYLWVVYGVAAVLLIGWSILGRMPFIGYSSSAYIWLVLLGIVPQLIGHSVANYVVRYRSASFVAVSTLGEPIGSAALAAIFLSELPSSIQLLGSALVLAGILIVSRVEQGQQGPSPHTQVET